MTCDFLDCAVDAVAVLTVVHFPSICLDLLEDLISLHIVSCPPEALQIRSSGLLVEHDTRAILK